MFAYSVEIDSCNNFPNAVNAFLGRVGKFKVDILSLETLDAIAIDMERLKTIKFLVLTFLDNNNINNNICH